MKKTDNRQLKTFENLFNARLEKAIYENEPALEWLEKNIIIDQSLLKLTKNQLLKLANKLYVVILTEREIYQNDRNTFFDTTEKSNASNKLLRNSNEIIRDFAKTRADDLIRVDRTKRAKKSAQAKVEKDPKQKEKKIVKECWEAWQVKPEQYSSSTNFATAMIDKFRPDDPADEDKHLSSVKKITEWCTLWQRTK